MLDTSIEVLKKIEEHSFKAYIVGGFVRDYVLNIPSIDVDICTNATPKELLQIFDNAIPNEEYGSVRLVYKKVTFEITTFRKETTINTLCMNSDGKIIDVLGVMQDLKNKVIKVVGDANKKLEEDALRILRCIRFATKLNFKIDYKTSQAIKKNRHLLKKLSYKRKKDELDMIFASKNSKYGISLIKKYGLDKPLELKNIKRLKLVDDVLGIWAQLDVLDNYQFNKRETEIITQIEKIISNKLDCSDEYIIYKYGGYITTIVAKIKGVKVDKISSIYENLDIYNRSEINITGDKIIELLDTKPGKWVSEVIKDIEKQIVYKKIKNTEDNIKQYIIKKYK